MVRSTSHRAVCGVGDHGEHWGRKVPGAEQSVEQETPLAERCVEQDVSGSVWHKEGGVSSGEHCVEEEVTGAECAEREISVHRAGCGAGRTPGRVSVEEQEVVSRPQQRDGK